MSRFVNFVTILLASLCLFSGSALAQNSQPAAPLSCANASVMANVNLTQFVGTWFEAARNPAPASPLACVEVDFKLYPDNKTLNINVTYSNTPNTLWMNKSMSANITIDAENKVGYNVSYIMGSQSMANTTYKLLDTNYNDYALICGFTNATDNSTGFGIVLTRQRMPTFANLVTYEMNASKNYSDFLNGTMANITQTDQCYTHSAASTKSLPILTALFAAFYALLRFLH